MKDVGYVVGDEDCSLRIVAAKGLERDESAVACPHYATCRIGIEVTIVDCHYEKLDEKINLLVF